MTYRTKNREPNLGLLFKELLQMVPDQDVYEEPKDQLTEILSLIDDLAKYRGYQEQIANGRFDEDTFEDMKGFHQYKGTKIEFSETYLKRSIWVTEDELNKQLRSFKDHFGTLVSSIRNEVQLTQCRFERDLFLKYPNESMKKTSFNYQT